jgi:hypothetical protein
MMELAEQNSDIYNKELLAVVEDCEQWHHYCHNAWFQILVSTNYQKLGYFTMLKI